MKITELQEKLNKAKELKNKIENIDKYIIDLSRIDSDKDNIKNRPLLVLNSLTVGGYSSVNMFGKIDEDKEYVNVSIDSEIALEIKNDLISSLSKLRDKYTEEINSLEL